MRVGKNGDEKAIVLNLSMSQSIEQEKTMLQEPIKKRFGGSLAKRTPFERLAMLQRNADALAGNWRGKNDGTHVRKVFGSSAAR